MCACDRYAAARRSTSFSCSNSRTRLSALATSRRSSVSTGGGVTPWDWSRSFCTQSCNAERDIPISSLTWRWVIPAFTIATASRLNSSEYFLGIVNILPAQPFQSHAVKESTKPTADPIAGITGIRRGKRMRTTVPATGEVPRHADYIERHWDLPWRPDQWWNADLTYVWTTAGFCYVSFVTDVFSRRILGWRVWTSMKTELVTSALNQALFTRRRTEATFTSQGLVHHSDAGSQYLSLAFSDELHKAGIVGSIGTVGDALDNAVMESTIGLFKTEVIDNERRTWTSWRQVEAAVASWVTWYNHERLHSSIGDVPPAEYEQTYHGLTHAADTTVAD